MIMQVKAKANVKFEDKYYEKGDVLNLPYNPNEELFEEIIVEKPKVVRKPRKKKLAK